MSITTSNVEHDNPAMGSASQRTERFGLRLTPDELARIRQGAEARRMTVSAFMVDAALNSVDQTIAEDRRIVVANAVFDRIVDEMYEPAKVIDSLAELLKNRRSRVRLPKASI
ncbi:MAG TPA: DUF1778 domain-containing protein [Streptosporangiaceae bacterium]|nr:DUF1778 domain-containing protein [Streptosporangiaceae bacterium]